MNNNNVSNLSCIFCKKDMDMIGETPYSREGCIECWAKDNKIPAKIYDRDNVIRIAARSISLGLDSHDDFCHCCGDEVEASDEFYFVCGGCLRRGCGGCFHSWSSENDTFYCQECTYQRNPEYQSTFPFRRCCKWYRMLFVDRK